MFHRQRFSTCRLLSIALLLALAATATVASTLRIEVVDADGNPLPCRIHLANEQGQPIQPPDLPSWNDHFVSPGLAEIELSPGRYRYEIERGPEYLRRSGNLQIAADATEQLNVSLERITNLRSAGWYSGDLHVHRPIADIPLLMRAEDLDFAADITWWTVRNDWADKPLPETVIKTLDDHRAYTIMAGEDEREGGALLYFGLQSPLPIDAKSREVPSPLDFVDLARSKTPSVWIDIEKPFWWDVPVWLASGKMNSIGLANNHMGRSEMYLDEAWGKPRDAKRLPNPRGNGYWTQEIYYHILNTGLRIPPSAGSASGALPNPLGYNRVYVHLDGPFTPADWFSALGAGRSFVTNGPLLQVTASDTLAGASLKFSANDNKSIRLDIQLDSQDPVSQLELIQNGKVTHTIPCTNELRQHKSLEFAVEESGWFLVRAIANVDHTFRFASTAPWYVEVNGNKTRISRSSTQFFVDWIAERIERVKENVPDESDLAQVLRRHLQAKQFWEERLTKANAN